MSRKPEIIEALWRERDLPFGELVKSTGLGDDEIRQDLRELVRAGVVNQKDDSVDHDCYRLSASGYMNRAAEDRESFELWVGEREDLRSFRQAAAERVTPPEAGAPELEIVFVANGAWVPTLVFVTWEQAGVDQANFWDENRS